MRFSILLSLALAFLSADVTLDGNFAGAAEKESDLDRGLVVCSLNSEKKIMCNCKQGTQACTDMIENSCGEGGASCAGGYCSCEAKDTMIELKRSLRDKTVGSGAVTAPSTPDRLRSRHKTNSPATGAHTRN